MSLSTEGSVKGPYMGSYRDFSNFVAFRVSV